MLQYKDYYMPKSKEELFSIIESNDDSFDIISGWTDLFAKEKNVITEKEFKELSDKQMERFKSMRSETIDKKD